MPNEEVSPSNQSNNQSRMQDANPKPLADSKLPIIDSNYSIVDLSASPRSRKAPPAKFEMAADQGDAFVALTERIRRRVEALGVSNPETSEALLILMMEFPST
jgi:hypothetical protein